MRARWNYSVSYKYSYCTLTHLHSLIRTCHHIHAPTFTHTYTHLPVLTSTHIHLHAHTFTNMHVPSYALIFTYMRLPPITRTYLGGTYFRSFALILLKLDYPKAVLLFFLLFLFYYYVKIFAVVFNYSIKDFVWNPNSKIEFFANHVVTVERTNKSKAAATISLPALKHGKRSMPTTR